jgi:hypothetical protein
MPLLVTDVDQLTQAALSLYIVMHLVASGMLRLCMWFRMILGSVTHSFVATILASQELSDVWFCRVDFQLIGLPVPQIMQPDMLGN